MGKLTDLVFLVVGSVNFMWFLAGSSGLVYLFTTSTAFAGTDHYDLRIEFSMNGKRIASPRVLAKQGETTSITQQNPFGEKIFLDVVANENLKNDKETILVNFVVGTISAKGEKKILTSSRIITRENEKAEIRTISEPGSEVSSSSANVHAGQREPDSLSLSVIATRKSI